MWGFTLALEAQIGDHGGMTARHMSDELRALVDSSTAELDSWLSQKIQDELGTRAFVLRAIAWCRRGALARARADIDAALAKHPAHELVELTGAIVSFVTRDYDRSIVLLDGVARRHRYMAAQALRLLIARAARLGWTTEQQQAQALLRELGVRDLRAHVQSLLQPDTQADAREAETLLRGIVEADEPTTSRVLELHALAPGLLSDAARELGETIWGDGGLLDDRRVLARVCRHALTMLVHDGPPAYRTTITRGVTPSGQSQTVLRPIAEASVARSTHAEDDADLAAAARLLLRSIEKQRGQAHRATARRSLDADQIEQFMADGYVHLRGAFPRELAQSIVASAHRRLREAPQQCLTEGRSRRWVDRLGSYDPEDPSTWPEGRVDIIGERKFTISEFSPFAERAVFQLLGDAARIRTRSWTSNLIAQYPQRQPPSRWIPAPDQESWHLDSPSTHTRIDQLRTGLLVFVVFSDLLPDSGNTWLALDSPAQVARSLAAAPAGIDFCTDQAGCAITRTCARFFEVTGEAGDLLLVHPLMLHSASPNPSPRIRFLGNPMVYLQEPLDHRRPDASPVERAIAAALG